MQPILIRTAAAALLALGTTAGAGAAELRLWRLDCGTVDVKDLDLFSDTAAYPGEHRVLTDSCYLVKHDADYMLWDTGLPAALLHAPIGNDALNPTLAKTLPDQLAALKLKPEAIATVGISHYHFDHTGQAADFPHARLLIGQADLDALKATPLPFGAAPEALAPWLKNGAPVEGVRGDKDVFGDGTVVMLDAPGHTPGAHALLLRLPKAGPVILSGDTVHFAEQWANNGVPTFNTDRAETLASMDRIKTLAANLKARVIIQHDPRDVAKLPAFPESLD